MDTKEQQDRIVRFEKLLNKQYIILDGASGTEFQKCGLKPGEVPERLNFTQPELIINTHLAYLQAGSDIILSNTFGASYNKLKSYQLTPEQIIPQAISLGQKAVKKYNHVSFLTTNSQNSILNQEDFFQTQQPSRSTLHSSENLTSHQTGSREILVAFDCGPLGALLEPNGPLSFKQAYGDFARQINLADTAGADLIMFETMSDLYELKIALLAAKENSDLPIICSMSFEENGRTFSGTDIVSYVTLAQSLGADVIGLNCSTGPKQLLPLIEEVLEFSQVPVLLKPNAGLPDPQTGAYDLAIEEFAEQMQLAAQKGVKFLGGCCGTTSAYVKALTDKISDLESMQNDPEIIDYQSNQHPSGKKQKNIYSATKTKVHQSANARICSSTKTVVIGEKPLLVGEQLNPTGKQILKQALKDKNYQAYQKLAIKQEMAGADILDINCGLPGINETEAMAEVVKKVQAVTRLPLQIDSDKPEVLEIGLRFANGRSIINSMNGKKDSMSTIIPLAKKYGAMVIILPIDEQGIPKTAEKRIAVFKKIIECSEQVGLTRENLIADCLVLTAAAEPAGATECLRTIKMVKEELGLPTIIGLSNISFGLPARRQLNQVFYAEALANGLDMAILNPEHEEIVTTKTSHMALFGGDPNQKDYIAYTEKTGDIFSVARQQVIHGKTEGDPFVSESIFNQTLHDAILQGLEEEAAQFAKQALIDKQPLDIIQDQVIPALDEVGKLYQEGVTFLPQLLQSSKAAQSALTPIRKAIEEASEIISSDATDSRLVTDKSSDGTTSKKTQEKPIIAVATVEGDIHDIGKNIAKTVLENYNYLIRDLGNDVAPERILEAVQAENIKLVGLSALMTSTLPAMEKTIKLLKQKHPECKIMVGGAVLTEEYAKSIGADYYCLNAKSDVDVAKEVFEK